MSTITGPKIQLPSAVTPVVTEDRSPSIDYMNFFHNLNDTVFAMTRSGPSASRPTSTMPGRFIGMPYFDTDLGTTLTLKSVQPDLWMGTIDKHLSSAVNITSSTVLTNVLSAPIRANEEYVGRAFLDVGAAISVTGIKLAVSGPTGSTGHIFATLISDATSAQEVDMLRTDTVGAALDFGGVLNNTANNAAVEMMFHITASTTAGTIAVQAAQSTSTSTPLVIRTGSQVEMDKTL